MGVTNTSLDQSSPTISQTILSDSWFFFSLSSLWLSSYHSISGNSGIEWFKNINFCQRRTLTTHCLVKQIDHRWSLYRFIRVGEFKERGDDINSKSSVSRQHLSFLHRLGALWTSWRRGATMWETRLTMPETRLIDSAWRSVNSFIQEFQQTIQIIVKHM